MLLQKKLFTTISVLGLSLLPQFVMAGNYFWGCSTPPTDFKCAVGFVIGYITLLIPLLATLALLVFVYGLALFIKNSSGEKAGEAAKALMIQGLVGLFVMFSVWGIVAFVSGELFGDNRISIPQIQLKN